MVSVLHVIDDGIDETQVQVLALLQRRLNELHIRQTVCFVAGPPPAWIADQLGAELLVAPHRFPRALNWAPRLAAIARECGADVVHAWGITAARAASARLRGIPLVITLLDPIATSNVARWVRSFPKNATVAAGSQVIRSRLISAGLPPGHSVVIRGGVDFAAINGARQAPERKALVGESGPVVLLSGPPSREGGQYYGIWASAIVRQIHKDLKVLMPYGGRESARLQRFVRQINMDDMLVVPEPRCTWPRLLAGADVFLCPAAGEICCEPLGWAMAAGVIVVGCAVRSICETVADKHNGLLCKPKEARALAARILTALEDHALRRRLTDVARAQAYEVFGVRAFTDHYARLYQNVLSSRPAGDGITDTAMVA